eukprot:5899450-Lingulodinium_polyedra.AAC.1
MASLPVAVLRERVGGPPPPQLAARGAELKDGTVLLPVRRTGAAPGRLPPWLRHGCAPPAAASP